MFGVPPNISFELLRKFLAITSILNLPMIVG